VITLDLDRNRVGAKALTILLCAGVAVLLLPYVAGLLGSAVLYVVARPLLAHLEVRRARRIAAFFTVIALCFVLVVPGVWIFIEAVAEVPDAIRSFEASPVVQRLAALRVGSLDVGPQLQRAASEVLRWGSAQTMGALSSVVHATINLVVALFGTYYLLVSADRLWIRFRALLPFCPTTSELLRVRFHRITEAMLIGVVLTALAQGTLVGLAFMMLGLQHALFWGAVTACASILPMFGSALVWLPASLFLALQERHGAAVGLALFGALVVSNIDNALRLVVYRRVSQIHPMVTLVGAFAGVHMFGLVGLVFGPLVLSYAFELVRLQGNGADEPAGARQGIPSLPPLGSPTAAVSGST
jgi:predicted PurR-regulated permease PerM